MIHGFLFLRDLLRSLGFCPYSVENSAFGSLTDMFHQWDYNWDYDLFLLYLGWAYSRRTDQDIDGREQMFPENWRREMKLYSPALLGKICRGSLAGPWGLVT